MSIRDEDRTPVHDAFGLTYASYFVLHRSLMEAMPVSWQDRFVALADEFWQAFDVMQVPQNFEVRLRDVNGRYESDPFRDYRHPNYELIESARRADGGDGATQP